MLVDRLADPEPAVLHWMVADGADLSRNAPRLRTRAHRPESAGFEDAARVAGQAVEVGECPRVGVGEKGPRDGTVLGGNVNIGRLAACSLSSDIYARGEEVVGIGVGPCHWGQSRVDRGSFHMESQKLAPHNF